MIKPASTRPAPPAVTITSVVDDWLTSLRARNRSAATVKSYRKWADQLATFLAAAGMPTDVAHVKREHVEAFLASLADRDMAPATRAQAYRSLQQFWKWAEAEGETATSPMARMSPPSVPEQPVPVLAEADLKALLSACTKGKGSPYETKRDHALVRLMVDTGMRASEVMGLTLGDVDFDQGVAWVVGKGARPRACPFGAKTADALRRYVRARQRHPHAASDALWLGLAGPMGTSGLAQILERRSAEAGIGHVHPHMLRHVNAHRFLANGGQETDLMRLMGWRSRQMVGRYAASAADERARDAHKRMALGDKL